MRVVLDTNVIVAGLAYPSGPPGRIVSAWRSGALEVVLSPWIIAECRRVLGRLPPLSHLTPADIDDVIDLVEFAADLVTPDAAALATAAHAHLRDLADEPVLATLLACGAELLVTGDKDLLALSASFPILTPAEFCARHAP